jgi:erythromycin esterase
MLFECLRTLALAAGLASGQSAPIDTFPLVPPRSTKREIGPTGAHRYEVRLSRGEWLRFGVKVHAAGAEVSVIGPDGIPIARRYASPSEPEAYPRIEFLADHDGVYQIQISADEWGQGGRYELTVEELLSPHEAEAHLSARKAARTAATRWFASHAVALRTVEAERGFVDLEPLKQTIGNARIVALGEATHGTREFFQLKHRMLEFLVTRMGFTAFAIEATMPECVDINRYVLTGDGDPARAIAALYFWTWNTEEVLELVRWMRRYNADPRHQHKIRFYGFDMQYAVRARKVVLAYLRKVDAAEAEEAEKSIGILANPLVDQLPLELASQEARAADYQKRLWDRFAERKKQYRRNSSAQEWELARQHLRILLQNSEPADGRDRAMADNIAWILGQEGPPGKIVVWAHNIHVAAQRNRMGGYLRERFGRDLVVFGFAFNQGRFQALRFDQTEPMGRLFSFDVRPAPDGSLDSALAATGLGLAAFPLKNVPRRGPVADWLGSLPPTRSVGAGYAVADEAEAFDNVPVASMYDALLFVDTTTAARALPGSGRCPPPVLPEPANLGFESGDVGQPPRDWVVGPPQLFRTPAQPAFGFEVITSAESPFAGSRCAEVRRLNGPVYGEFAGGLGQRIQAAPYRGKRIRLRAAVRTGVEGEGNQAHLWLLTSKAAGILSAEAMLDHPITSGGWHRYEVLADVPNDADFVDYGLALAGVGRAWLDDVSIEVAGTSGACDARPSTRVNR